jgi:alkanesulfonate monooxygenase SsuD/methylene tetrahydromethanopterin reductase-like flavin-dependent oxidoreductase (luciferase family)
MAIGIGLGCAEFPFSGAAAYWRWIDMCEAGGVDSIWQTDRIVSRHPFLEWMTTMADFDFSGAFYKLKGAAIAPKPVQPDLPMWIGGSTDAAIRRTARIGTGWQAGGEPPADAGRIVAAIKAAVIEAGRIIDEDHYGAGFAFHFGSRDAPVVGRAMDAYAKRTGRDALAFAVGDAETILARVAEYVDAGVSKFILRPLGCDDEAILAQTRLLIEQVLPHAEAR